MIPRNMRVVWDDSIFPATSFWIFFWKKWIHCFLLLMIFGWHFPANTWWYNNAGLQFERWETTSRCAKSWYLPIDIIMWISLFFFFYDRTDKPFKAFLDFLLDFDRVLNTVTMYDFSLFQWFSGLFQKINPKCQYTKYLLFFTPSAHTSQSFVFHKF